MFSRFCIFIMIFVMFIQTVPAQAAMIDVVDLSFGANNLSGNIDFSPWMPGLGPVNASDYPNYYFTTFLVDGDVTLNGTLASIWQYAIPPSNPALTALLIPSPVCSGNPCPLDFLNINTSDIRGLNFADFELNGVTATGGTVSCTDNCNINATPIPASLPLFVTAILGLIGFSLRKRKILPKHNLEFPKYST